jgi:hypothetical protein
MTTKLFALILAFVLFAVPASAASVTSQGVKCPATVEQNGKKFPLKGMSLFDGDPKENADLAPDMQKKNRNMWTLHALKDGRSYNLVCRYEGTIEVQAFTLDKIVSKCVQLYGKKNAVACK